VTAGNDSPPLINERDLATVRRGYELWNQGDIRGLADACFTDDIEYRTDPDWPGQNVFFGREAVEGFLRDEVAAVIALSDIQIEEIEQIGGELLITLRARTQGASSGIDIPSGTIFHVARLRDGRVDRVRAFLNEDEARAAAEAG
jgi:ketosteroid isomerase-like protein